MPGTDLAVIQLLWDLINQKTGELGKVDFLPQKPPFDFQSPMEQPFPRCSPEAQGVDSLYLHRFVSELVAHPSIHMHQVMILRHGHVIYEGGFDPYPAGVWHATYSMCKSFTGMAIGLLIGDGKLSLDDHLVELLPDQWAAAHAPLLSLLRYREITVRHLLTMSTGVAFNEAGAISGNDWVKNYFESGVKFQPGTQFEYNSMNSLMLSAIVSQITGTTMFEFLKERLFVPMGIRKVFWETSPKGLTKGGWGMFLTEEDAAKLGYLYMHSGVWNGRQLISRDWVRAAVSPQIKTDQAANPEYGYHLWMDCRPGSFCYNGMLGQNVHCFPDIDMVIITNAGNAEVFQAGVMTDILRQYFGLTYHPSEKALPENLSAFRTLQRMKSQLAGEPVTHMMIARGGWNRHHTAARVSAAKRNRDLFRGVNGVTYHMNRSGVGLFPLIMQVVHNNYTNGISELTFSWKQGLLTLTFQEGAQIHAIPVGFGRGRQANLNMNGEDYLVSTRGRLSMNEDMVPVLSLQIAFPEEATERQLKIFFTSPEQIELHWNESPGDVIIADTIEQITIGSGNANPIMENLFSHVNPDIMQRTLQSAIQPVVTAERE